MESSEDKQWATKYLLDPLNAPEPSEETGPSTSHYNSTFAPGSSAGAKAHDTQSKKSATSRVSAVDGSTASKSHPSSARHSHISSRRSEVPDESVGNHSSVRTSSEIPTSSATPSTYDGEAQRRRASSLTSRFPGDLTHRPLDIIRRESKRANRAPHLRKQNHHGLDTIDRLASADGSDVWHHDGPFEAASLARNRTFKNSPLEAVARTNAETLKATPREMVVDSIQRHRPLDGVAVVPPGFRDRHGRIFNYEEGTDMQREAGGDYRRWPGIDYHPDDLKGKGEPSYSIENALKQHRRGNDHRRVISESGIEMSSRPTRSASLQVAGSGNEQRYSQWESEMRRSGSNNEGKTAGFRRRLGSLRRRRERQEDPIVDAE